LGGPRLSSRWVGSVSLVLALAFAAIALGLAHYFDLGTAVTAVSLTAAVPGLYLAWATFRGDRADAAGGLTLDMVADDLAVAVRRQWENEAELRRLNDPHPLPVSWDAADADLVETWSDLVTTSSGWPGGPVSRPGGWARSPTGLSGTNAELGDLLSRRIPTGRLVVLGEPGSGKTMLLVRLVLDLLYRRAPRESVPVLVGLSSWNPAEQDLHTWLASRLIIDHPGLGEPATPGSGGVSWIEALLDRGLILPILDGLDEIPKAVRGSAIARINEALRPRERLVVSSRIEDYRDAVNPDVGPPARLRGAAGITLRDLDPAAVRTYLQRDAASTTVADRWKPVLDRLGGSEDIAQTLRTPLMVSLAAAIYNPRPDEYVGSLSNPAELCDTSRFPTPTEIEQHLLDAFVKAAYRPHPDPKRRCRWTADQAERWLSFLAQHLERDLKGTTGFAWWQLHFASRPALIRRVCGALAGLTAGVVAWQAFGLLTGVGATLVLWFVGRSAAGHARQTPAKGLDRSLVNLFIGLITGLLAGLILGLSLGLLVALVAGLAMLVGVPSGEPATWFWRAFVAGLVTGALALLNSTPTDLTTATSPRAVLARDRLTFLWAGIGGILTSLLVGQLATGIPVGLGCAAAAALILGFARAAWGPYAITQWSLAIRRRLPWRLMTFLSDAHEQRGVLRQAGAFYEFRHRELQYRLTARH
jgi:hypothetical protein